MPLIQVDHKAFYSLPSTPIDDPGALEAGWVQFNQITMSSESPCLLIGQKLIREAMSRAGTFRVDQRIRED